MTTIIGDLLLLGVGLALIIKGADRFVSSSVRIAELLRMPRVIIGSTLVSLATTTPEMTVSVLSGLKGESGLAVGNAVGSCICNLGLILGVLAALKHVEVHSRALRTTFGAMFACGVLLLVLSWGLNLNQNQGALLLVLGVGYFAFDFWRHQRPSPACTQAEATELETEFVARHSWLETGWGVALQFLMGATFVVGGSKLLVDSAVHLAQALGLSSLMIGLTIVAVGTSLPELITAITSSRRNVSDLAVGNLLGANIANLTLIVGSAASIHPVPMSRVTQLVSVPAMLVFMVLAFWMMSTDRRVSRREGVVLLVAYVTYLLVLVGLAVAREA